MSIQKHCVYYRDDENKIYYYDNSNNRKYVNSTFYDKDTDELYYFDENGERHVIDIDADGYAFRISYDAQTEELSLDFSPLPVEFIDYLELGTGRILFDLTQSQWRRYAKSSNKIILDTELTNTTSVTSCILGFKYTSESRFDFRYYLNGPGLDVQYSYGSTNTIFYRTSTSYYNKRMIISYDKGTFKFDDLSANIPYTLGDLNLYSIGYLLQAGGMNTNQKVYGYKVIDENENEVINAVPAKRKLDNVVGMYDLVTNTFIPVSYQN